MLNAFHTQMNAPRGRGPRGFSLLEMMLVVALISIFAALAVPAMGPAVDTARLEGSADAVASLFARAQAEAMASKRCVRVVITGNVLTASRLNAYDCDVSPSTSPKIDSSAGLWVELARLRVDPASVLVAFDPDFPLGETAAANLGGGEPDQIRFRPSGRLWSADSNVRDDDAVVLLTQRGVRGGVAGTKRVLVQSQGLICLLDRGVKPTGSAGNLDCVE